MRRLEKLIRSIPWDAWRLDDRVDESFANVFGDFDRRLPFVHLPRGKYSKSELEFPAEGPRFMYEFADRGVYLFSGTASVEVRIASPAQYVVGMSYRKLLPVLDSGSIQLSSDPLDLFKLLRIKFGGCAFAEDPPRIEDMQHNLLQELSERYDPDLLYAHFKII